MHISFEIGALEQYFCKKRFKNKRLYIDIHIKLSWIVEYVYANYETI